MFYFKIINIQNNGTVLTFSTVFFYPEAFIIWGLQERKILISFRERVQNPYGYPGSERGGEGRGLVCPVNSQQYIASR